VGDFSLDSSISFDRCNQNNTSPLLRNGRQTFTDSLLCRSWHAARLSAQTNIRNDERLAGLSSSVKYLIRINTDYRQKLALSGRNGWNGLSTRTRISGLAQLPQWRTPVSTGIFVAGAETDSPPLPRADGQVLFGLISEFRQTAFHATASLSRRTTGELLVYAGDSAAA
jgi:hypothetical protein